MKKKILTALTTACLVSSTAFSHTNSIGYVGDGNGGLNFWYGSWHDNTQFNEAEIKIVRPDGTESIDAFDLLEQDSPAGLISGINFFSSDGTQLIPYDPTYQHPMGMPMESYTWQGINYTNLATGEYTFVYIPLGDPESNLPGSPTAEWVPMDEVIRSLTITLTQGDLDGDANENGILDIEEVESGQAAEPAPVGPTVVSQGSSTAVSYLATSNSEIQVVQRTQTDTMWDNMSDGTIANLHSHNTSLSDWTGRTDQIEVAQDVVNTAMSNTAFDGIQAIGMHSKMDNSMSGSTRGVSFGAKKETESGFTFGLGFARLDTSLSGNGDSVSADTDIVAFSIEKNNIELDLRHSMSDYDYRRTIGEFANAGSADGKDTALSVKYEGDGKVRPIVGYTRGKQTVDGYKESGSVQTARTVSGSKDTYDYATVGGSVDLGVFEFSATHQTDDVNDIMVSVEKTNGNTSFNLHAQRTMTDLGDTNTIRGGILIRF